MNTVEIFFSPTGGTEKVAHIIAIQKDGEFIVKSEIVRSR